MPFTPDAKYVNDLLTILRNQFFGSHHKMMEIEDLRYMEDRIMLGAQEKQTGVEVRIGLTADLIENVKAATTANPPIVDVVNHRDGDEAVANAEKRKHFHNELIKWINSPVPVLSEFADSQIGLGLGILKAAYVPWPTKDRKKKSGEDDGDYNTRQKALKKKWGPPIGVTTVHPMSYWYRSGIGNKVDESVEQSYKARVSTMGQFNIQQEPLLDHEKLPAMSGLPDSYIRGLPAGIDTSTQVLVTEYRNQDKYQLYVNTIKYHEAPAHRVGYFIATGRTTSSKDPDKFSQSVAEVLRHNEPVINRTLTRIAEATELLVKKKLALLLPEGSTEGFSTDQTTGEIKTKTYALTDDAIEVLPVGAQIKDPWEGVQHAYDAIPFLNLLMSVTAQHGVSPIFKGMPPGAAGSGYRDNSLYMMAKAQYKYLIDSYQNAIKDFIVWVEDCIVKDIKQEVFCGEYALTPSDIEDWPASVSVTIKPDLPQNMIAEGQFYDRMHTQGHVSRDMVREKGIGIEYPADEGDKVLLEHVIEALEPILVQDAIATALRRISPATAGPILGPDGNPISSQNANGGIGGAQALLSQRNNGTGSGRELGGYSRAGVARQPPEEPGSMPGMEGF